ncbi:hypothetical protein [uncultured Boseongicola sp.]|jgi:hypothetical protein|uniref:hypothetical protein n=1 Tax=uncultured Boseongicola sp. TaxID=1648499 RepID=UPI0026021397|nr:hypothetical protein [uncultured Boseongicola sp.]
MTRKVAVLGLGTRGGDIARAFHATGWAVSGFDPDPIAEGVPDLKRDWTRESTISSTVCGADWVVICLPERLELMRKVIQRAQGEAPRDTTIAVVTKDFDVDAVQGCALRPAHVLRVDQGENGGYVIDVSSKTDAKAKSDATMVLSQLAAQEFGPKPRSVQPPKAESA